MKFLDRDSYLIDFIGIYFLIICAFFTILRDMDIYYMYLILVIINGVVAIFAYIISVVTLSTAQEKIYKDLARIFGIVAVLKILFAIYVFDNLGHSTLNQEVQNQEVQMTVLNLAIQTILYTSFIYVYVNKKKNNIFNNVIHMIMILIPIMYILITWTNILPNMYVGGRYSIVKNILCIVLIMGYIYNLLHLEKLNDKFYNYKIVKDLRLMFLCRIGRILIMVFFGGVDFVDVGQKLLFINKLNCISLITLEFIHVYIVYTICFRDIIKRPNRHLYYNLLDEKEKLQKNIETLEVVNFNMEYYKIIYEQLLKNMPGGILISSNRKIMFANNKALELFNLKSDEKLINKSILDLVYEPERGKYTDILKSLNENDTDKKIIYTKFSYNGVVFDAEEIRFYENVHEKIFQVSIINNREDKIKLENAEKELELRDVMEKARDEVLSNISHEFKTPVNVIYSTVQIQDLNLQKGNYGSILEFNKIIKKNCNRLIRLINNFIDSTKLENNKLEFNLKCVNIVAIVEDITISVVNFAKSKNTNIIFDTEEEELYCDIDVEQLERIILNILSNAIKYNKVNGNIDVVVKDKNEEVHIEVSDTGVGIPKDKVDIIFDRFERFDNKNAAIKEGSGIGLSIVKKLVDALGGKIEIKSEVDKGTTVRLIFKKSNSQNNLEQIYDMQHLEEKVNLEMSDIS